LIRVLLSVISAPRIFVSPANRRCSISDAKSFPDIAAFVLILCRISLADNPHSTFQHSAIMRGGLLSSSRSAIRVCASPFRPDSS
jgi:hypothetical protein